MNNRPVKQAWLSSVEIAGARPLDEVRKGASKFYRFLLVAQPRSNISPA